MIAELVRLDATSLSAVQGDLALQARVDRKHIVDRATLDAALRRLAATHAALEIDGRRSFRYDTIYFDTPDLQALRAHVQRRAARFKCRSRLYADTGSCWFELKRKDRRGATVKLRLEQHPVDHGRMTAAARAFLGEHLDDVPDIAPVLRSVHRRATLAGPGERVTVDVDVEFAGAVRLDPGWAIVETKSARGGGIADRVLHGLGSRPVGLSKYVVGVGTTRLAAPPNDVRRIVRRFFRDA